MKYRISKTSDDNFYIKRALNPLWILTLWVFLFSVIVYSKDWNSDLDLFFLFVVLLCFLVFTIPIFLQLFGWKILVHDDRLILKQVILKPWIRRFSLNTTIYHKSEIDSIQLDYHITKTDSGTKSYYAGYMILVDSTKVHLLHMDSRRGDINSVKISKAMEDISNKLGRTYKNNLQHHV